MILSDSGPLIAAAVSTDTHYRRCVDLFAGLCLTGRRLLVPSTVVAEVGYLLEQRVGPRVEAAFLQAIADGDFEPVALEAEDLARMAQFVAQYDDLPLGTTDASVIALSRAARHRRGRDSGSTTLPDRATQSHQSSHPPAGVAVNPAPHLPHEADRAVRERYRTPSGSHVHRCPAVGSTPLSRTARCPD